MSDPRKVTGSTPVPTTTPTPRRPGATPNPAPGRPFFLSQQGLLPDGRGIWVGGGGGATWGSRGGGRCGGFCGGRWGRGGRGCRCWWVRRVPTGGCGGPQSVPPPRSPSVAGRLAAGCWVIRATRASALRCWNVRSWPTWLSWWSKRVFMADRAGQAGVVAENMLSSDSAQHTRAEEGESMSDFHLALSRARERTRFSQDDVGAALGVSRAMVSYWEAGSRTSE